jgi:hypothetical protein
MAVFEPRGGEVVPPWTQTDRLGSLQAFGVVSPELGNLLAQRLPTATARPIRSRGSQGSGFPQRVRLPRARRSGCEA